MGWFDEQIRTRSEADEAGFAQAFAGLSSVVMGRRALDQDERRKTEDAIGDILKYYRVPSAELPADVTEINAQLEYLLRPAGVMRRVVALKGAWYKDAIGAMLGRTRDGDPVALIPSVRGYRFYHHATGEYVRVTEKTACLLAEEALCFYKPLPLKKLNMADLLRYMGESLSAADVLWLMLSMLGVALLGLLLPYVNNLIFGKVIQSARMSLLLPVTCLLLGVTLSMALINITKQLLMSRMQTRLSMAVQSAAMMRVLSLPADFFKKYSAGELSTRTQSINSLCTMLINAALGTGLTSVFSLVYVAQIAHYAPALVIPAMLVLAFTLLISVAATLMQLKVARARMQLNAKQDGLVFAFLSGIQKIKLAGAERRAFAKWAQSYEKVARLTYDPPFLIKINSVLTTAASLLGVIAIYYFAALSKVSVAEYMAFNTAYGMLSGAFATLASAALTLANIRPVLEMVEPILEAVPEVAAGKKVLTRISGNIEINNVSFRYAEDMPLILNDFSLRIRAGEYLAVVGQTGCGKSTLMRLLLGFEKPQKGTIYYDGLDIASLDLRSLRRNIGVVMQNGKLFQGDIYANIVISAPWLTQDDAWRAAEMAGIAEDIRKLPMGMHTLISEGGGGISGGQRQRLMIARAVAPNPRILMFDEATSALDNITQKKVAESLDALRCTRIVIAHRLSTIQQCDRIIVLQNGGIVEDGNYDTLIRKNGFFAALVARQRLETENRNDKERK